MEENNSVIAKYIKNALCEKSDLIRILNDSKNNLNLEFKGTFTKDKKDLRYDAHVTKEIFNNPIGYLVARGIYKKNSGFIQQTDPNEDYKELKIWDKDKEGMDFPIRINFYLQN